MPSILEYFQNDFKDLSIDTTITVGFQKKDLMTNDITEHKVEVKQRLQHGSDSSTRLFTFYVPDSDDSAFICQTIINDLEKWKKQADGFDTIGGFTGDKSIGTHSSVYSNRLFFYTEKQLYTDELANLDKLAKEKQLYITFRSHDYLDKRIELQKPFAFISHDSGDKELIARPLANGLNSRLCFVWYDEFSLKVGESLRESIEKGIKEAKKCVLILTPNFLNNPGWGKKEFNSIFTREMIMDERVVLPIWFNVSKEDVYNYSPSLADTFALTWPSSKGKTEDEYKKEVEIIISKLHTAVTAE